MFRKFGPLVVFFLACSSPAGKSNPTESGGEGGDATTGGKSGGGAGKTGTGGSPGKGGSGGSSTGGSGGSTGGAGGSATGGSGETGGAGGSATGGSSGTGGSTASGYKFGAHPQTYPAGSIKPAGTQAELDAAVKSAYDKWKAAYVAADCEGYIVKSGGGDLSSSSAMGTGMMVVAMMAGHDPEAQTVFDGMLAVARKFPSYLSVTVPAKHGIGPRPGNANLLAYAIGAGCKKVSEGDSAADGDFAFGHALALAEKQWGSSGKVNYLMELKNTAAALKAYDMTPAKLPGIGDWATLPGEGMWTTVAKPTGFMVAPMRAFGTATGEMYWMQAVDAVQATIAEAQTKYSPMAGLFSQYLMGGKNLPGASVLPDDRNANAFFDDAALIPFFLATDYIASSDMRSKAALTKINDWLKAKTAGDPSKIVDGYRLNGDPIGTKGTMAFVAPFATTAIFDAANQAWVDALWKLMAAAPTTSQAADTANMLGLLVVSGNWWQP